MKSLPDAGLNHACLQAGFYPRFHEYCRLSTRQIKPGTPILQVRNSAFPRVLCATPVLSVVQLFAGERDPLDAGPHSPRKRANKVSMLYTAADAPSIELFIELSATPMMRF